MIKEKSKASKEQYENAENKTKHMKTTRCVFEDETRSSRRKKLSANQLLENPTSMNSCCTWMTINPPNLYLPVYLSSPNSSGQPTPQVFSSPSFLESPLLSHLQKATKVFGFGYSFSHFQCHSLTHKVVFVDEEGDYKSLSIQWKRWKRKMRT